MGGFYRISEWVMRLTVINLLWLVCSLPFFYFGLVLMVSPDVTVDMLKQGLVILGILSPFTLVPATAAVFTVARKWVTGDEDVPLFKTYFRGYKENYKQSMLGGLFYLLLGVLLYVNYHFYGNQQGMLRVLSFLFITLFFIAAASFLNFLSIMVHFHMKFSQLLKNSFFITIGRPITSVSIVVTAGAILFFSYQFTFLIPFFVCSLIATASFWYFHRSYIKLQDQRERMEQAEREALEEEGRQTEEEAPGESTAETPGQLPEGGENGSINEPRTDEDGRKPSGSTRSGE